MMSKLGHFVFVYIRPFSLCLNVPFHLRTYKNRLETSLHVKIEFYLKNRIMGRYIRVMGRHILKPFLKEKLMPCMCRHKARVSRLIQG